MELHLPYGDGEKTLRVPPEIEVDYLAPAAARPIEDVEAAFERACSDPVGERSLHDIRAGGRVVILVADITRGKGTDAVLPLVVRLLADNDVAPSDIHILVARGTHRKLTREERDFFRSRALAGVKVEEHDCDATDKLSALLLTRRGTPVRINELLRDAGAIILLSPVSFHYFAGFGGGRKLVLPGCADRAAILANHRLSLLEEKRVRLNPACGAGVLDGNPVHEDMVETLEAVKNVYGINFFSDVEGNLLYLNTGDPILSHARACAAYSDVHARAVETPYSILVLSAGGFPYDINFLQSHKPLRHCAEGLRDKGTVLYYAHCSEGTGSKSLEAALTKDRREFLKTAYRDYDLNNQTAVSLHDLTRRFEVGMVSAMNVDLLLSAGIKPCVNPESFLVEALEKHGTDRIAVVRHGANVLLQPSGTAS